MSTRSQHPLGEVPVEQLNDAQWRAVTTWRLSRLEDDLRGLRLAMWSVAGSILVGVIVYLLTNGPLGK